MAFLLARMALAKLDAALVRSVTLANVQSDRAFRGDTVKANRAAAAEAVANSDVSSQ